MVKRVHFVKILAWKNEALVLDAKSQPIVDFVYETRDVEDACRVATDCARAGGSSNCVRVAWCSDLFSSLADYIAALNFKHRLSEEMPGDWVVPIVDDVDYWASRGITTPRDLEIYYSQDICQAYEMAG